MEAYGRLKQNIVSKSIRDIKNDGLVFFSKKSGRFVYHKYLTKNANKLALKESKKPEQYFDFQDKKYAYFIHPYNLAWINERTVEIPIVLDLIKHSEAKKILEVGAVLPHYTQINWDVLDKFEKLPGVINKDIIEFLPKEKYDLIVTISTLEHVGFDDENKPEKVEVAIDHLKNLLNNKGKIIATMPLGYNKFLDDLIYSGKIGFTKNYFMKRDKKNKWTQVSREKTIGTKYNNPYNNANCLYIGVFEK